MATPRRHTFSGAVVTCLVAGAAGLGSVQAATASDQVTSSALVAQAACPPSWPALRPAPHSDSFDGNVSVLVGGDLWVTGAAAGAEGTVVTLGDATFARDVPGPYEVGATLLGSQVTPFAGSDMLVVGGTLTGAPGTHVDVGQGLGGDVVVGAGVTEGTDLDAHGGVVDTAVAGATAPYLDLAGQLAAKSMAFASQPVTGTAEVTDGSLVLSGDGISDVQVFTLDAVALGTDHGRSLQLTGIPEGTPVKEKAHGSEVTGGGPKMHRRKAGGGGS